MSDSTVGIDEPAAIDKRMDTEQLTVAAVTVQRERVQVAGATDVGIAVVTDADAAATAYGLVVRPIVETAAGALFAKLTDGTDTALVTAAGELSVLDGNSAAALTALQLIDNIVHTEDEASADGHSGVLMLARRTATPANTSGLDLDYEVPQMNAGRLWVDASGVTLTVASHAVTNAGTFAVQVDGAALTALQLIDDPVFADDAAFTLATSKVMVAGAIRDDALSALTAIEGDAVPTRVDANGAQWVVVNGTVTVGSHAVTNAGTFAVQVDGAALTALQLIDDPVLVDDAAFTPATSKVMMAGFQADETAPDSVDEGDAGAARMSLDRKQYVIAHDETSTIYQNGTARTLVFDFIDDAVSGDNTLVAAAGAGNKIRVLAAFLVSAGTVNVRFESGAGGTALTGQMNLVANTGFVLPYNPKGWFETAANTLLNLELSAAISVDGCYLYVVVT